MFKAILILLFSLGLVSNAETQKPNFLFITVDDMNWDSLGAYGSKLKDITPSLDKLASEGMRFNYAYAQASNCSPSRNVFQTGRYPHSSGMRGFFYVNANFKTLPEILKDNGYYTGVLNKPADTSLTGDFDKYWDLWKILKGAEKRGAIVYKEEFHNFLETAPKKPFYCVVNIADPHKPFYNDLKSQKAGYDKYAPKKIFEPKDVNIPPFLPKHPSIKQEMTNYYNSVRRADDCVGAILDELKENDLDKNTVVLFISDHGMPLPFAKSMVYQNGVRIPWLVRFPDKVKASSVDTDHMISAVDFMPSILDLAGIEKPQGLQGKSFHSLLFGGKQDNRDIVFTEFNENASGLPRPTRGIQTKNFTFAFNPWATGNYPFQSSASFHKTYKTMVEMAKKNPEVKKRLDHLVNRSVLELYDNKKDPHALKNLADNPEYKSVLNEMRQKMLIWMTETKDYLKPALENFDNKEALNQFMENELKEAKSRWSSLQWKRFKNQAGGTGKNKELFQVQN